MKKELDPLIPLADLKRVVADLVSVPKPKAGKKQPKRPKRRRARKNT